jgi:hypothetical protein
LAPTAWIRKAPRSKRAAYLRASQSILIDGGTHASGQGVLVYPSSEINTFRPGSTITIASSQDAAVLGLVVAAAMSSEQFDSAGGYRGRSIVPATRAIRRSEWKPASRRRSPKTCGQARVLRSSAAWIRWTPTIRSPADPCSVARFNATACRPGGGAIELRGPSGVEVMAAAYNHELVGHELAELG